MKRPKTAAAKLFKANVDSLLSKRLNFDRLDDVRVKRCAKPVTVRRAIWPG